LIYNIGLWGKVLTLEEHIALYYGGRVVDYAVNQGRYESARDCTWIWVGDGDKGDEGTTPPNFTRESWGCPKKQLPAITNLGGTRPYADFLEGSTTANMTVADDKVDASPWDEVE
jgi:hypothetical protein